MDRFIYSRLEKESLEPASEADRATLLRRLSLDLVGLPPTLAELDAFIQDASVDAYDKQVERLLASPHHGERWGRHWLDAARYADSNGYEKDLAREMWHWRDWVIDALNRDLPYDQFLVEQLAGDLLPNARQDQVVATGFLRNSMINEEGAIDPEQFRMESMFDRMDCLGKSILGLTIQCAQCHNHKYDPLSQEEYYRLFAFINNDDEHQAAFYTPEELREREAVLHGVREAEDEIRRIHPDWRERMDRWVKEENRAQPAWTILEPHEHGDPGGLSKLQLQPNGSLLAGGHRFTNGTWRIRARTRLEGIRAVRLEVFTHASLPLNGPGRSHQGLFGLKELRLEVASVVDGTKKSDVAFADATSDFAEPLKTVGSDGDEKSRRSHGPVKLAVDGDDRTSWTIDAGPGRRNTDHNAVFIAREPFGFAGGAELTFQLAMGDEIGCFRLSVTTEPGAAADPLPRLAREAMRVAPELRSVTGSAALFSYWRTTVPEFASFNQHIDEIGRRHPDPLARTLVLSWRSERRPTRLLKRGDWLQPGEAVEPGVPSFLHSWPQELDRTRLGLARWITDRRAPTTARVIVNRVWQSYFGTGIVSTPEDFGFQVDPPSHPELLDWLACELMEPQIQINLEKKPQAWSLKHLHRLIVHSATYRQSSHFKPVHLERDPQNRLLARGPRLRVEGEIVRDLALAVSGLLEPRIGGPPVYAPAPEFLFRPPASFGAFPWKEATGPERYRRAFYTFRRRSTPYPVLLSFDAPSGDTACVRRSRSNTPLQALATLNETVFVESARALARRMLVEGGPDDASRLSWAFRCATGREPDALETLRLLDLVRKQRNRLADGWLNAAELGTGSNLVPMDLLPGATPVDLAAYTVAARVILNLDETITKG